MNSESLKTKGKTEPMEELKNYGSIFLKAATAGTKHFYYEEG
ncbi:hypothetical protein [Endozoicomonas sp. YOMI1]|nr:hypothetical protein [Endozoicomonas sp. YOMI1]